MIGFHFPWGKHRGKHVSEVPRDYLIWALNKADALEDWQRAAIVLELERRRGTDRPQSSEGERRPVPAREVIQTWYREMSLRFHPDRGGSTVAMQAINHAHDRLKALVGI